MISLSWEDACRTYSAWRIRTIGDRTSMKNTRVSNKSKRTEENLTDRIVIERKSKLRLNEQVEEREKTDLPHLFLPSLLVSTRMQ
jgi:hypothetical protein